MAKILVINPGATSTKFAVFDDNKVLLKKVIEHQEFDLRQFAKVCDQHSYRMTLIIKELQQMGIQLVTIDAIVGRGGLLKPIAGGTYQVNELMLDDLKNSRYGEHAANLGAIIAYDLAQEIHVPAFIVDPVAVDEMSDVARISGSPELVRVSMSHALNMKAVARKVAADMGSRYENVNLVMVHLGTGISVSVHSGGKMIDTIDGKDEGPFAPDRCGGLPSSQLVKLCYSGKYTYSELQKKLFGSGGLYAYLGTKDIRDVEKRVACGDKQAELILQALIYQIAKEIGAFATVVSGNLNGIVLTGGMAYSQRIVDGVTARVKFIAPVIVVPGEEELESLAAGAQRVLQGEETAKIYQ